MPTQFVLDKNAKGEFWWKLLADNNETVAMSSESYKTKADAGNGITLFKTGNGKFEGPFQDAKKEWRWRFVHANGKIIATSAEGYQEKPKCDYGMSVARKLAPTAPVNDKVK